MMKSRDNIKILLLQIREDEETMLEEFYEFVQFSELHEDQVSKLNVYEHETFSKEIVDDFDALFIGGSSDATVRDEETYRFVKCCRRLIRYCYEKNLPVLASCFGFQLAVKELGGEVILDKDNMEIGMYELMLTSKAKDDPLLYDYPEVFHVVSGHKERALTIPKDTTLLAYTELCPYHLIKFTDKPFYGFQFHPEVDRKDLIARIKRYQERYLDESETLQKIIDGAIYETTYSNRKRLERAHK